MKKLFFAALVAVAAVGGAVSVNAQDSENLAGTVLYNCTTGIDAFCEDIPESQVRLLPSQEIVDPAVEYSGSGLKYDF